MSRFSDVLLTALAPAIWGSSYIVTTELLPDGYPLHVAMLRALPAGLLLLLIVRKLPSSWMWVGRVFLLGALNFSIFWWLLFESAYRLPGGVAATVGALQPLIVIFLARYFLAIPITIFAFVAAIGGFAGVALLILSPDVDFDLVGLGAGALGAVSMALGTVLSKKWQPPVSSLTFCAWQLSAGGLLLVPAALLFEPGLPDLTLSHVAGYVYLGLIGGAVTYILWFRGISRIEPSRISVLGFLSPAMAVFLGWSVLDQNLTAIQIAGFALVLCSVWVAQKPSPTFNVKRFLTS
jgi:probable blue pigment (indigoidine) exporter